MSQHKPLPPLELVRERLRYWAESGAFTWNIAIGGKAPGAAAGHIVRKGKIARLTVDIKRVRYYANRLAWLYMTGEDPGVDYIRCINGDPTDCRWENLERLTPEQWKLHLRADNRSELGLPRNVQQLASGRYLVRFLHDGQVYQFPAVDTVEEAVALRDRERLKLRPDLDLEQLDAPLEPVLPQQVIVINGQYLAALPTGLVGPFDRIQDARAAVVKHQLRRRELKLDEEEVPVVRSVLQRACR